MLQAEKLNAYYGDSHALHDITMQVPAGARVAVLGRNGAGKSTFLKSVMGGETRVEGSLRWKGRSLLESASYDRARQGFSYVPEDRRIFPMLSVTDNIRLANRAAGRGRACFSPEEMFERFPMLRSLERRMGDQLSGGQQQMLAVARGLSVKPEVLLLDEPTEGLAPIIVEQLAEAVDAQCRAEAITLVLCEQNVWFARQCTEFVHILNSGRLVFSGTWLDFDADADIKRRYLAV